MQFMYDNYPPYFTNEIQYYIVENICFDEAELYTETGDKGVVLEIVAAHEFGKLNFLRLLNYLSKRLCLL